MPGDFFDVRFCGSQTRGIGLDSGMFFGKNFKEWFKLSQRSSEKGFRSCNGVSGSAPSRQDLPPSGNGKSKRRKTGRVFAESNARLEEKED